MNEKEMRCAQQELMKASHNISSAGMRLEGTKYEQCYRRLWNALEELNNRLVNDIRGGK